MASNPSYLKKLQYSKDSPQEYDFSIDFNNRRAPNLNARTSLLAQGVRINPKMFPGLAKSIQEISETLNLKHSVEGYIRADSEPQAMCLPINLDVDFVVLITSSLIQLLNDHELKFIIGHEVGHFIFGHHGYPQTNDDLALSFRLRSLELNRAAEISADRVGFICSPSLEDSIRGMIKIATGLSEKFFRLDVSSYLSQLRDLADLSGDHYEIYSTHPMFPLRVRALLWFSMSQPYYDWINREEKAPISAKKLDEKIAEDFNVASGFSLSKQRDEAATDFKLWAILSLISADRKVTKSEQSLVSKIFGDKVGEKAISFLKSAGNRAPEALRQKRHDSLDKMDLLSESSRNELIEELERFASSCGGSETEILELLSIFGKELKIKRNVCIRPWTYQD